MAITTYSQWRANGSPWYPSNPARAFASAASKHGVGYGIIGDVKTHLDVSFPEDHAPYSHTPWPGAQPYPWVLAVDLYTTDPVVARRIIAAKRSGRLPCLKYINWTDEQGRCWHTSWEPTEASRSSTDRGHIHSSFRTDHTQCDHAAGFDPFIEEEDLGMLTQDERDNMLFTIERYLFCIMEGIDASGEWKVRQSNGQPVDVPNSIRTSFKDLTMALKAAQPSSGGLSAEDRAAIAELTGAVNQLNSRLASP